MTEETLIRLGSIEGKVDLIIEHLHSAATKERDQDLAIHGLQQKVWWAAGAMGVLAALFTKLGWPLIAGPH